jgi:hypothetical protein
LGGVVGDVVASGLAAGRRSWRIGFSCANAADASAPVKIKPVRTRINGLLITLFLG